MDPRATVVPMAALACVVLVGCAAGTPSDGSSTTVATSSVPMPSPTVAPSSPVPERSPSGPPASSPQPSPRPSPTSTPTEAAGEFGVAFPGVDWTRPDGSPADTREAINLIAGSDQCGWQDASLLHIPWPLDGDGGEGRERQYVWDPANQLEPLGISRDDLVDEVPSDAVDTGFRTAHQQLWLGDDVDDFAYLVAEGGEVRRLQRPLVLPDGILGCG